MQYYSMSHEIFHCFGANHDRANSRTQHPYGHGLQVPGRFRTIMAYKCASGSCPRVPYLSANGFKYNGVSLGNAATNNARLVAENSQVTANLVRSVTRSSDTSDQESQPVARPVPRPVAQPRQATQPAPKPATTLRVVPNYDTVPDSSPVTNPGTAPVQYIASTDSQCRSNPVCAELSTEGFCCPNTGGVYMACCTQANEPSSSTKIEQDSNSTHWWWKSTTSCTGTACVQVDKLTTKSGSLASTTSLIVAIVAGMATMLATIF